MTHVLAPSLYLSSGICVYAAVTHLRAGLRRSTRGVHLLFAAMCLVSAFFAANQARVMGARDLPRLVLALRWSISSILLFFILFSWFVATYTRIRPFLLLLTFNTALPALFVANLVLPNTIQYRHLKAITFLRLPWGESIAHSIGQSGSLTHLAVGVVLIELCYALWAMGAAYRRARDPETLYIMIAIGIFSLCVIEGILVRLEVIHFVQLGLFAYLAMVIAMSVVLDAETVRKLDASESRSRSLIEQSPIAIQVIDRDGQLVRGNQEWEQLWEIDSEAQRRYNAFKDPMLIERGVVPLVQRAFSETSAQPSALNGRASLGAPFRGRFIRSHIAPIRDEKGNVVETILMHEDESERQRIESAIRRIAAGVSSETGDRFFNQLVATLAELFEADAAFIGVVDQDEPQRINTLAVYARGTLVPPPTYLLPGTPCDGVVGKSTCAFPRDVWKLFPEDRLLVRLRAEGYIGTPLFGAEGKPLGLIAVISLAPLEHIEQVSEILEIFAARAAAELQRLAAETRMRRMAYEDFTTGLNSRAYLNEHLSSELSRLRASDGCAALLQVDLDHFKTINDALGHDVGDQLLRAVAARLRGLLEDRAFLARLGGDEFVAIVVLEGVSDQEKRAAAREIAGQILESLTSPLSLEGERTISIGASIGITIFPDESDTTLDILRHAEMAVYRAKSLGRNLIQFYLPKLEMAAADRLRIEEGLRRAIREGELELSFQPQVDDQGRMVGAETLLRWNHPDLGSVPPRTFMPVAEETGLIHGIGAWTLEQSCQHLSRWLSLGIQFEGRLAINVCPRQFVRPDFLDEVRRIVTSTEADPHWLALELTETALLYDLEGAIEKLKILRQLGLLIALDDFGTGYSSLFHLKELPLDVIKIDQAFVGELGKGSQRLVVESMVAIGQQMGFDVIAEGVESERQREILIELGCRRFQGFLFSPPSHEQEFLDWIEHTASG